LINNYPNPFNASTTIEFEIQSPAHVKIDIYNVRGQLIQHLFNAHLPKGFHRLQWDGTDFNGNHTGSGLYLVSMKTGNTIMTQKILMMK